MLVYIHGFNSSSESATAKAIKAEYPDLIAVDYDYKDPDAAVAAITKLATTSERVTIIASSLGGWFAEEVAKRAVCDLILINPSLKPTSSLVKYGVEISVLNKYKDISTIAYTNRIVILGETDDVVPPEFAELVYKNRAVILKRPCGHRLDDFGMRLVISAIDKLSQLVNE